MNRRSQILKSQKSVQKKKKKIIIIIILSSLSIIFYTLSIILFLRLEIFQISNIYVTGVKTINVDDIKDISMNSLNSYYLGIIPKTNIIFYSSSILKNLKESFKKIDSLNISRHGISGIDIDIKEKDTKALICSGFYGEENQDQKCYSVDEYGFVFEESPDFSSGVFPHYYLNIDINKKIIGNYIIESKLFNRLQNMFKVIENSGIHIFGLFISDKDEYELYIRNIDSSEAVVYFDNRTSFEDIADNLILFWNDTVLMKKNIEDIPIFEYINLKFGNNIFYVTK